MHNTKDKEKTLKASKEKTHYIEKWQLLDFQLGSHPPQIKIGNRRTKSSCFWQKDNCQPRILYLTKMSFKNEVEIKPLKKQQQKTQLSFLPTDLHKKKTKESK